MQETKFDRRLQTFYVRASDRLEALDFTEPKAKEMRDVSVDLLRAGYGPYSRAVDDALVEGEEAQRAAEEVAAAESECEAWYGRMHAKLKSHYYDLAATNPDEAGVFEARLERALPHTPSTFERLGVDRTLSAMEPACAFGAEALGANHPTVVEARTALDKLQNARSRVDAEEGESVEALQELYAARTEAKRVYNAARKVAEAALILEETDESIGQLIAPLRAIYEARRSSVDEDEPAEPVGPVDPAEE